MWKIFLVGLGGFVGTVLRYLASGVLHRVAGNSLFPYGTVAVNLVGCLVVGFLSHLVEFRGLLSDTSRVLVIMGVLGGFTTFSAFGNESFNLLRSGQMTLALANIGIQVIVGLAAVWLGRDLAFAIWR